MIKWMMVWNYYVNDDGEVDGVDDAKDDEDAKEAGCVDDDDFLCWSNLVPLASLSGSHQLTVRPNFPRPVNCHIEK